jgi:cytochrome c oxidase subunit 1
VVSGGVDTGWTFYTPYSSTYSNTHVMATAVGVFITGFSSILTGLNFIVTIHRMRAPGMTWFRLPLFVWAHYATSLIQVLGTPVSARDPPRGGRRVSTWATRPGGPVSSSTCSGSAPAVPS